MKLFEVSPRVLQAIAIACIAMPLMAAKPATSTQTGQGIDVELKASGTFAAHETDTYHYNETTAATYFTNTLTSGPAISCTGGGQNGDNCAGSNQPSPSAPGPDPAEVNAAPRGAPGAVDQNKCNFLDGGALDGHTYTQSVTVNGVNGRGNWTFTWSYAVNPTVDSVAPFTAWDLVNTHGSGGVAAIDINADIMGESAMLSSKMTQPKYSFSMIDGGLNRVADLLLTIDGTQVYSMTSSVVYPIDFIFMQNAGVNGVSSLLRNGNARTILNSDGFPGNDNGGSDGSALAKAVMTPLSLEFANGQHSVTLTGTVKGNSIDGTSTGANLTFSITHTLTVVTPGCSGH